MDPALWELLQEGDPQDEVAAIIRLRQPGVAPAGVRLIAQFGDVATCRVRRGAIPEVHEDAPVVSFKAPRVLAPDEEAETDGLAETPSSTTPWRDDRRPVSLGETGQGVVVGIIDWGLDFAHPDFRHADGSTRLLAFWDQSATSTAEAPEPYRYGKVYTAADINRALAAPDPYAALNYHPADADPDKNGSHATHVGSIAAGNGRAGGPIGVAPDAALVFVHLATGEATQ